ncbi:MAG TPA: hypothetical protein VL096_02345, partial [Pirellulaceae bacterium]|nr:hypothetical protein [Pirellulaceae bacterium]
MTSFWRLLALCVVCSPLVLHAADDFEEAPILYSATQAENKFSQLADRLESGNQVLRYDDEFGYLPALLAALEIP